MEWLAPWSSAENKNAEFHDAFKRELESEVGPNHPLHGIHTQIVAQGYGDDVLFQLLDGTGRFAVVHLTWAQRPEPFPCPAITIYNSLDSFVTDRMIPEHEWLIGRSKGDAAH